jgi:hypothetical protein
LKAKAKGEDTNLMNYRELVRSCWRVDHSTARRKAAQTLRCGHLRSLAANSQFPQILVQDFEMCAANDFCQLR